MKNRCITYPFLSVLIVVLTGIFIQTIAAQDKPARTERIRFAKGASAATVSGTVRGTNYNDYIFSAREGQEVNLKITSRQSVNFTLLDKATMLSFEDADGIMPSQIDEWSGTLPKTGEYIVRVFIMPRTGPRNRTGSFKLSVSIIDGGDDGEGAMDGAMDIDKTVNYICDPNAELRADYLKNGRLRIRYGTQDFTLDRVRSGSGAKYEKDGVSFWSKGREAMLDSPVLSGKCKQQ